MRRRTKVVAGVSLTKTTLLEIVPSHIIAVRLPQAVVVVTFDGEGGEATVTSRQLNDCPVVSVTEARSSVGDEHKSHQIVLVLNLSVSAWCTTEVASFDLFGVFGVAGDSAMMVWLGLAKISEPLFLFSLVFAPFFEFL